MRQLELGGGTNPHPLSEVVIDLHHPKNSNKQDAAVLPWEAYGSPIEPESFDVIYCSHFLEHIPAGQQRINVFNEAWRVLKHGGRFDMKMPLIGYNLNGVGQLVNSWQPWADPTHVGFWWFPESLLYFCEGLFKPHADYGYNIWKALGPYCDNPLENPEGGWCVLGGWEGYASIIKP
jgi:SAM-dependent methyltransferase